MSHLIDTDDKPVEERSARPKFTLRLVEGRRAFYRTAKNKFIIYGELRTIQNGLPKDQTTKWLPCHQLGRKTSILEHIHKYPQFVAGERAGGKVRKKFK